MSSLKLISLNLERSKHLNRVLPFLESERADVVCLQELCERDIPRLQYILGICHVYAPSGMHPNDAPGTEGLLAGVGIFSRLEASSMNARYYVGSEESARAGPVQRIFANSALVICEIRKDQTVFRTMTTHFTWSSRGEAIDAQRSDMRTMLALLATEGEFVLCGDFNAPRGGEIFSILAANYRDNVPPGYRTSIDINFHRAGKERPQELADKMVDGLFTTPGYAAPDVRLQFGVSDHAAIVATITRL